MPEEEQGKSEYVSFDSEGYKQTPDDDMREKLEAEIVGQASEDKQQQAANPEAEIKEEPHKEDAKANTETEEPKMEQNYEQQNAVPEEEGLFYNTRQYVMNNPLTVAVGVAAVAGATLFISKKIMKPSVADTLSLAPASSMASAVAKNGTKAATKAAKYALMMRH